MYEEIEEGGKRKQVPRGNYQASVGGEGPVSGWIENWSAGRSGRMRNGQKHTKRGCVDGVEDCCGRRILESQPDFREQKGMVEEEITQRGHLVMFYPKFHCELNWIEYFWGDGKRRTRQLCDYTFNRLRKTVPEVLESTEEVRILRWLRKRDRKSVV